MLPLGVDEATALVITDTQQAGLKPPTYAFAPTPKKNRHPCRFGTFSFDVSVEPNGQTVNVGDVAADPSYLTAFGTTRSESIVPVFDRLNQKVVGTIDVESEQPFAFHEEVQSALENLAKEILKLWYYAEQFRSTPE